ncbi:two-component system sensor histidine kinase NtrB [Wenzhouxiangella marina]|uniref:Sensory histidine kinase/phosphatase NtrB n=1 Tax=Wenzhouxiangella marina TaxID=1579979 RepID=A0A0K0XZL3_9GAMM|nr:ATP-binding protein [Wenzhouxiangella marina]AKS43128.1 hypothetical protein WM2015_2771 [Wenzhouxiangella marina]MBB6087187.1 two-component system nitrogen regulation sensor histidine kinase GlnL [Wenzhouxiangella marina]
MSELDPDRLSTGLIRVDPTGRIRWLNRAAATLLEQPQAEVPGSRLGDQSDVLERSLERVQRHGGTMSVAEIALQADGPPVDLYLHPLDDDVLIELHPVAERVRQRERADRADRQQAIALLARGLAHELRNPLAGVRGAAQLIEHTSDPEAARRHARMIQREVDRITGLIEHVAGDSEPRMAMINLHQVIDDAIELVQAESGGRLAIQRHYDPSIPEQRGDADRLHQLFLNLLRNSVQAGALSLRLSTRIEHDSALVEAPARHAVRIELDDDGEGVPETLRDRLFLPLVTGRERGSGFGLAVVQQIARAHGGLVDYQSLPRGSRFTVRLPLHLAREAAA